MGLKILVVGYHSSLIPFISCYTDALRELGHMVDIWDPRYILGIQKGYAHNDLLNDIHNNNIFRLKHNIMTDQLINQADRYDLILFETGKEFTAGGIRSISKNTNTVMICFDDCWEWQGKYTAKEFSCVVTMEKEELFRNVNPNTINQNFMGVMPYHQKMDVIKEHDVSFFGSAYPNRKKVIKELKDNGIDVFCIGNGWDTYIIKQGITLIHAINQSKICLHIHRQGQKSANFRFFETMGCGTYLLSNYYPDNIFRNSKNKGVFGEIGGKWKDIDHLILCIDYALNREESYREHVAKAGYNFIHLNFSIKQVCKELLESICEVLKLD